MIHTAEMQWNVRFRHAFHSDLSSFLSAAPYLRTSPILRNLQMAFKSDLLCYFDLMSSMIRDAQKRVSDMEATKSSSTKPNEANENEAEASEKASDLNEAEQTKEENVRLESKIYEASLRRLKELAVSLRYGTNKCD